VKRIRFRSAFLTGVLVALLAAAWWYLAPTRVGGSTTYVATYGVSMQPRFHSGDLALVRPAGQYRVGDIVAYHSSLLHLVVLHRIVAIRNGHYTFKGDNNNFLDPVHPTRPELIGRLWVQVRGGGFILKLIHDPMVDAVACGLLGLFLLFGADQKRRRGRRQQKGVTGPGRVGPIIMKAQRQIAEARPANFGPLFIASVLALAVCLLLAVIAFTRPPDKPTSLNTPYTQRVSFAYTAHIRPGPVYPTGTINTGDPLFLSMVRRLNLHIAYGLTTNAPASITGTEKVVLTLFGPGGWKRNFVLAPQTRFAAAHTSTDLTLDLPQLQASLAQVEKLTNSPAFGTFSAAIVPQVQIAGTVAGHPVKSSFQPALNLQFNSGQLLVSASTRSGSGGATGSAGSSQTNYAPSQSASVSTPATAPATITVLGVSPTIVLLRWIAVIGLLLSIAATIYFYLRKRSEPFVETARIQSQYGHMIVPIVGGEDLGWPPVDVPDIKALVKLAEAGQRLILHNRSNDVDTYMLNEEGTVYRYQVKPSKVVWGEWSASTAHLEEAASTIARAAAEAMPSASSATSPGPSSEGSD
jgi:signal peptidase I